MVLQCVPEGIPALPQRIQLRLHFNTSDSIFNTSTSGSLGDTEPISNTSSHPPHSFTILYTNCRSLLPKINHVRQVASTHQPHIISICEILLDDSISSDEVLVFIPWFSLICRDRDRHGGGIAIFIHNSWSVQFTIHLKHPTIDLSLVDQTKDFQDRLWPLLQTTLFQPARVWQLSLETTLEDRAVPSLSCWWATSTMISWMKATKNSLQLRTCLKQIISAPTTTTHCPHISFWPTFLLFLCHTTSSLRFRPQLHFTLPKQTSPSPKEVNVL